MQLGIFPSDIFTLNAAYATSGESGMSFGLRFYFSKSLQFVGWSRCINARALFERPFLAPPISFCSFHDPRGGVSRSTQPIVQTTPLIFVLLRWSYRYLGRPLWNSPQSNTCPF